MSRLPVLYMVVCTLMLLSVGRAAGHLEEEARARIDTRVEVLQEVAARLRAGEQADDMRPLLYALANDDELPAFLHLVHYESLPPSHRPSAPDPSHATDRWPFDLPPVLLAAYRDVEDALAPGPYRLEEYYWRGIIRDYCGARDDAVRDLQHYVSRTHISRYRTQEALYRVARTITRMDPATPDPRAVAIFDQLRHDDRVDLQLRHSATIYLGQIYWKTEHYAEAGDVFTWFVATFPEHSLRRKSQLLAAQSYMKAAIHARTNPLQRQHLADARRLLRDLIDLPRSPAEEDVRSEAMFMLSKVARWQDDDATSYKTLKWLTFDYPTTKWAKMHGPLDAEEYSRVVDDTAPDEGDE